MCPTFTGLWAGWSVEEKVVQWQLLWSNLVSYRTYQSLRKKLCFSILSLDSWSFIVLATFIAATSPFICRLLPSPRYGVQMRFSAYKSCYNVRYFTCYRLVYVLRSLYMYLSLLYVGTYRSKYPRFKRVCKWDIHVVVFGRWFPCHMSRSVKYP